MSIIIYRGLQRMCTSIGDVPNSVNRGLNVKTARHRPYHAVGPIV